MFEDNTGVCPNCGYGSGFKRDLRTRVWPKVEYYATGPGSRPMSTPDMWIDIVAMRCLHCNQTVVLRDEWVTLPADNGKGRAAPIFASRHLVYPAQAPRELHEAVPNAVRSFYREASQCEQIGALRAASVLYRAAVEELVNDQKATGVNLYQRIESLKGGPAADLVDDLHEARMLGNDSIHDGLEYTAEEVADVAELIEEATVLLYVQPAQRKAMRESRKQRRSGT